MKKDTAELLVAIKSAGKHGATCWIGQGPVVAAQADGVPLVVVNRKEVTTGGKMEIECEVQTTSLETHFAAAEKTLVTPLPGPDADGDAAGEAGGAVVSEVATTV